MSLRALIPFILFSSLSSTATNAACVSNSTADTLLFTIDGRAGGARIAGRVKPGAELCLAETSGAVLRVFASREELEGCSRIVETEGRDTLVEFHRYDNCRWASHGE